MNSRLPWILLLLSSLWTSIAPAQTEAPAEAPRQEVTLEEVDARIAAVEADVALDATIRESALETLQKAREEVLRGETFAQQALESERGTQEAPGRLTAIESELAKPPADPEPEVLPKTTVLQVEAKLEQARANLAEAKRSLDEAKTQNEARESRRQRIPEERAQLEPAITTVRESIAALSASTEAVVLKQARELRLRAQEYRLRTDLRRLTAELDYYEASRSLRTAELARTQRRLHFLEELVSAWEAILKQHRDLEAKAAEDRLHELKERATEQDQIRGLVGSLDALTAELTGEGELLEKLDAVTAELQGLQQRRNDLLERFAGMREKLGITGLNHTFGLLLRREFESLPPPNRWRLAGEDREKEISKAQLRQYDLKEELASESDVGERLAELLEEVSGGQGAEEENPELQSVASELLVARRDRLTVLVKNYRLYIERLIELEQVDDQFAAEASAYREFIAEQILWVRSLNLEDAPTLKSVREALAWIVDPAAWSRGMSGLRASYSKHWILYPLGALALLLMFGSRQTVRRRIRGLGERAKRYSTDRFSLTLETLGWGILLALRLPSLLWFCGALLRGQSETLEFASSIGEGLQQVFELVFILEFVRVASMVGGLFVAHFRWPADGVRSLRVNLRWALPLMYLHGVMRGAGGIKSSDLRTFALELPLFCATMVASAVFTKRVFSPTRALLHGYFERHRERVLTRTRHLSFSAAVLAPVALLVLALLGYFYTATILENYILLTWQLVFLVLLINSVLMRWLFVARRHIAVGQALERRAEREAAAAAAAATDPAATAEGSEDREALPPIEEDKIDIPAVDAQTRKLFQSAAVFGLLIGLFAIWSPVFPALRVLDRVQVWPRLEVLENQPARAIDFERAGESASPSETVAPSASESGPPISPLGPIAPTTTGSTSSDQMTLSAGSSVTLLDVFMALLVLFGTMVAAANLPGLLEIVLLSRLPLEGGVRYAISRIVSYAIYIIGFTSAFGALGIGWDQVQWLAAAMTFGLAFGLQEIFANFISGLILLFERPIRVGDVVTIGGIEGQISRIRMRATTVTDWDRREMLVPNREFITGSLINWTLSDPVSRITLLVGLAYGSDTKLAQQLLLETAAESPLVLREPKPSVLFNEFGDNSLNFRLRCFIPNRDVWADATNDLHMRVDAAFRKAGLEIAFPQRDLHLKSVPKGFFAKEGK